MKLIVFLFTALMMPSLSLAQSNSATININATNSTNSGTASSETNVVINGTTEDSVDVSVDAESASEDGEAESRVEVEGVSNSDGIESQIQVQKQLRAGQDTDDEREEEETKESGEKGGTADINIGVGELSENDTPKERIMQPDYGVSLHAREVRGWDKEKKEEFQAEAKSWARVQSGQDLEHFAQGILLQNQQVESLSLNYEKIEAKYKRPAKFLGIINTTIDQETTITFGDGELGARVPENVKVKFPWYKFLFKVDSSFRAQVLENDLNQEINIIQQDAIHVSEDKVNTNAVFARVLDVLNGSHK